MDGIGVGTGAPQEQAAAEQPATEPVLPGPADAEGALDDKVEPAAPVERSVEQIADDIADQCAAIIADQSDAVLNQVMGRLRNRFGG